MNKSSMEDRVILVKGNIDQILGACLPTETR